MGEALQVCCYPPSFSPPHTASRGQTSSWTGFWRTVSLFLSSTCNLSLTGLTKLQPSATDTLKMLTVNKCIQPQSCAVWSVKARHKCKNICYFRKGQCLSALNQPEHVTPCHHVRCMCTCVLACTFLCVYACFTEPQLVSLINHREQTKQRENFSSSLSLLRLWLPISSH